MSVKISELPQASTVNNTDIIPIVQDGATKKASAGLIFPTISHNCIFRGKDITDLFYSGTLSRQIANQTFDDIFIGDYIIGQTSGNKYLVADINYKLNAGTSTPHILMMPEKNLGTAQMNTTATTTGAYVGSAMFTTNLASFKTIITNDFGSSHILSHSSLLADAVTNGYESHSAYTTTTIDLMNEIMVHGSNIFHNVKNGTNTPTNNTQDNSQLAIFRIYKPIKVSFASGTNTKENYWLRDVLSASDFCIMGSNGQTSTASANSNLGVRPAFLVY